MTRFFEHRTVHDVFEIEVNTTTNSCRNRYNAGTWGAWFSTGFGFATDYCNWLLAQGYKELGLQAQASTLSSPGYGFNQALGYVDESSPIQSPRVTKKKCDCDLTALMQRGCRCGGV